VSLLQLLKLVPVTLEEFCAEARDIAERFPGVELVCGTKVSTKGVLRTLEKASECTHVPLLRVRRMLVRRRRRRRHVVSRAWPVL